LLKEFRGTSLDDLPQLPSTLAGDLSSVEPQLVLFKQAELVALRIERGFRVLDMKFQ
jgi:lipopolysaccharide/colanic/teichoic acid biosynthesis glycosyltransferase